MARFLARTRHFSLLLSAQPILGPIKLIIQWVPVVLLRVKQPEREVGQSLSSSAKIKN